MLFVFVVVACLWWFCVFCLFCFCVFFCVLVLQLPHLLASGTLEFTEFNEINELKETTEFRGIPYNPTPTNI